MAAVAEAFATVELLEQILIHLPLIEVIRKQRVCKSWHSCVHDSVRLRRKLFKAPIELSKAPKKRTFAQYSVQPVRVNPLMANTFRIRHSDISGSSISLQAPTGKRKLHQLNCKENMLEKKPLDGSLNDQTDRPIILDADRLYGTRLRRRGSNLIALLQDQGAEWRTRNVSSEPYEVQDRYACADWSTMLLTQPPITNVTVRSKQSGKAAQVVAVDETGVTLGDLVRTAAELYRCSSQPGGYLFDSEAEIYQSLEVVRPRAGDTRHCYRAGGAMVSVHEDEDVGFIRAWKTSLKCNLG